MKKHFTKKHGSFLKSASGLFPCSFQNTSLTKALFIYVLSAFTMAASAQTYTRLGQHKIWNTSTNSWGEVLMNFEADFAGNPGSGIPTGTRIQTTGFGGSIIFRSTFTPTYQSGYIASTQEIRENYVNSNWVNSVRRTITNDANEVQQEVLEEAWVNSAWVNSQRTLEVFTGSNHTETNIYHWVSNTWQHKERTLYQNDGNGNPVVIVKDTIASGSVWNHVQRDSVSYNSSGLESIRKTYVYQMGTMMPMLYTETTYDSQGNIATMVNHSLMFGMPYMIVSRMTNTQVGDGLENILTEINSSFVPGSNPIWTNSTLMIWDEQAVLSNDEIKPSIAMNLYPNPASNNTTIAFHESNTYDLTIYNSSGKQVLQTNSYGNQYMIDVRGMSAGVYIISARNPEGISVKRLLVIE